MQRKNRAVLMLSGSSLLFGITSGVLSLGWEEWQAVRKRAGWAESRLRANFENVSRTPFGRAARNVSISNPPQVTPQVPADAQAPRFQIISLDPLTRGRSFYPVALNNKGEVLGGIITHDRDRTFQQAAMEGAVFRGGQMVSLAPLAGYMCLWPMGMNNQGQAVCIAYNPMQVPLSTELRNGTAAGPQDEEQTKNRVVLCGTSGTQDLHIAEQIAKQGVGGHPLDSVYRTRVGINDLGQITLHADSLYWWSKGKMHLAGMRMALSSPLLSLCNSGVLVRPAVRAVVSVSEWGGNSTPMAWYDVTTQQETPLDASDVWDMNANGDVLCSDVFPNDARLRQFRVVGRKGQNRVVATVRYFGSSFLNDQGQVVGLGSRVIPQPNHQGSVPDSQRPQHGPFWCGEKQLYDLNDLIPENSGWTILQVRDFNNRGEILVYATQDDGKPHALLLRPLAPSSKRTTPVSQKPTMASL